MPAEEEDKKLLAGMGAEKGVTGLKVFNGVIYEDSRRELRWPHSNSTYQAMSQDATISAATALFETLISRVPWSVVPPEGASKEQKKRAKIIDQCRDDMEQTWLQVIKEVTSKYTYGFAVLEKVYRRRRRKYGSKYDDGFVGIRKLAPRSQTTIKEWVFKNEGRDLSGLKQDTSLITDGSRARLPLGEIFLPREKFLLFRTDSSKDNPQGRSPLNKVWTAWQFRRNIEESEAVGITRGLGGIPYFKVHPKYLDPDATPAEKATLEEIQNIGRNLQNNEQACVIFPALYDENNNPIFDFELLGPPNASQYDTDRAIIRWDNKILQALFADLLQMGNTSEGSHNLAENKSSMVSMAVEARLKEIQDVFNNDLIPDLYRLNGWELSEDLPSFEYGRVMDHDIDAFSKAIQRMGAVGYLHIAPENINYANGILGFPSRLREDLSIEETKKYLTKYESRAGDGMEEGTGSGTAKGESNRDNSAANKDN